MSNQNDNREDRNNVTENSVQNFETGNNTNVNSSGQQFDDDDYEMIREVEVDVPKKLNFFQRIASLFASPVKLIHNIRDYPNIIHPLIILIVFIPLIIFFSQGYTDIYNNEVNFAIEEKYGHEFAQFMAETQRIALEMNGASNQTVANIGTTITMIATMFVGPAISALIYFILSKILKGKSKYSQFFSLFMHLYIISSIGNLLMYIMASVTGNSIDIFSLGILVPNLTVFDPIYLMLSSISVFSIWTLIITGIGFSVFNGFGKKKTVIAMAFMFAGTLAISYGTSFLLTFSYDLTRSMMGM